MKKNAEFKNYFNAAATRCILINFMHLMQLTQATVKQTWLGLLKIASIARYLDT